MALILALRSYLIPFSTLITRLSLSPTSDMCLRARSGLPESIACTQLSISTRTTLRNILTARQISILLSIAPYRSCSKTHPHRHPVLDGYARDFGWQVMPVGPDELANKV